MTSWFRSSCNFWQPLLFLMDLNSRASSANSRRLLYFTQSGMSSMYIRNCSGPNTDPCGSPDVTSWGMIVVLFMLTGNALLISQLWTQLIIFLSQFPNLSILHNSFVCGTTSNTFSYWNPVLLHQFLRCYRSFFMSSVVVISSWVSHPLFNSESVLAIT